MSALTSMGDDALMPVYGGPTALLMMLTPRLREIRALRLTG